MYRLTVSGKDFAQLKSELLIAASSIKDNAPISSSSPEQESDEGEDDVGGYGIQAFAPPAPVARLPQDIPAASQITPPAAAEPVAQFDSRGIPWDGRVHSTSRAFNKDGTWRARRGVEDHELAAVEKQLMLKYMTHITPAAPTPPVAAAPMQYIPPAPVATPPPVQQPPVAIPVAAAPQYQDPVTIAAVQPVGGKRLQVHDFKSFTETIVPTIATLVEEGRLTPEYIQGLKAHFKVQEIWQLNETQRREMFDMFAEYGLIRKVG